MLFLDKCANIALSALLSDTCLSCRRTPGTHHGLCDDCLNALRQPREACPRCGLEDTASRTCGRCQTRPPAFDACVVALRYEGLCRTLVHRYKYRADLALARPLGARLAEAVRHRAGRVAPDLIIPVPLHYTRLMTRGYNQSMALARAASRVTGIPVATGAVARIRRTGSQQVLTAGARETNLRDAFAVRRPVAGIRIAVVDDVMTTGATLDSLAGALRAAQARTVECWVLARA